MKGPTTTDMRYVDAGSSCDQCQTLSLAPSTGSTERSLPLERTLYAESAVTRNSHVVLSLALSYVGIHARVSVASPWDQITWRRGTK